MVKVMRLSKTRPRLFPSFFMKKFLAWLFLLAAALPRLGPGVTPEMQAHTTPQLTLIDFDAVLAPHGITTTTCWGGMGFDHRHNLYAAYTIEGANPPDTALVRYNVQTGVKQWLGTLRGISAAEGNLEDGESMAKVHALIREHNGKLYFASHDFHGAQDYHRGAHIYSFDVAAEQFEDLSKTDPGGVSGAHQGIIALEVLRPQNTLVGHLFPSSDTISYDLSARKSTVYPAPPADRGRGASRHLMVNPDTAKVYFWYATKESPLQSLDLKTGEYRTLSGQGVVHRGSATSMGKTPDGKTYYFGDEGGYFYAFHVDRERLVELGNLMSPEEHAQGFSFQGRLILSHDAKKLFVMGPYYRSPGTYLKNKLMGYDIPSGARQLLADFTPQIDGAWFYGGAIDDQGRIYYCNHTNIFQISEIPGSVPRGTPSPSPAPAGAAAPTPSPGGNP
jgi:hypothetical protein